MIRAVLEGFASISDVKMDLARDAFALCHDAGESDLARVRQMIELFGFSTRLAPAEEESPPEPARDPGPAPEPVAAALAAAREADRFLLVDFYADWCAPCKIVEEELLPDPAVKRALAGFLVLRVDLDRFPEAGKHYRVDAMPTLLALSGEGRELHRFVGLVEPGELAGKLRAIRSPME